LVALIVRFTYVLYCKRHFAECRFLWGFDRRLLSRMFAFSGWAFLGNGAIVLKDQGSNVLLNLFGGPAVNAARGIAMQVNAAVYSFVMNFMQASNPQITKNYASGNLEAMYSLIIRCSKFSFFIMLMILLPLCAGVDYVLRLWLVDVPAHTVNFVVLTLLYSLVECFLNPLITGMLAQGNIKSFEIGLASLYTVNFMASYVCLKLGMPVETVFVLNIVFKALVLVVLLIHSKLKFAFPVARFCKECLSFSLAVFLLSALFIYILPGKEYGGLVCFGVRTFAIMAFIGVAVILIGMTREERDYVVRILKERLSRAQ
jgi:Na+-driven multidrug efflux pump